MTRYVLVAVMLGLASLTAVGVVTLRRNADPALLIGEWNLDAGATLSHQGYSAQAKTRPDIVGYVERKSVAARLVIAKDGAFHSYDGKGENRITATWRHTQAVGGGLTQALELIDQKGQLQQLEWILLSEDTLRLTFPQDNTLVFRRVAVESPER